MANTAPTHDDLLDMLRADIASHDTLEDRRAAVETYALFVSTVIQYDSAYEDAPEYFSDPDAEIHSMYVAEFSQ